VNSSLEKLIKDLSDIYSETRNVEIAKSPKIGNVFNPHKSHPSRKCRVTQKPRNSSVLDRKTKNPFEPKLCLNKGFYVL